MAQRAQITIASYSPDWPILFTTERTLLLAALAPNSFQIEHVGSTAVEGLAAKPVIDMMLGATSLREVESQIESLERLGYEYVPQHEDAMPERRFFAKPLVRPRLFHLHSVVIGSKFWIEHIVFRDALRAHNHLAIAYEQLKRALADEHGDDRDGYTAAKGSFITTVIARNSAQKA